MENNNDWLKSLKVGDKVFVHWHGGKTYLRVVQHITPKGNIRVDGNLFKDGRFGRKTSWYLSIARLEEYNEENKQKYHEQQNIEEANRLMAFYLNNIDAKQAEKVIAALKA